MDLAFSSLNNNNNNNNNNKTALITCGSGSHSSSVCRMS